MGPAKAFAVGAALLFAPACQRSRPSSPARPPSSVVGAAARAPADADRAPTPDAIEKRLAPARSKRVRSCGGGEDGPARFYRSPEIVVGGLIEPRAVAANAGSIVWVESPDPERILALDPGRSIPRVIATATAKTSVRDLRAHRGHLIWSEGGRVRRVSLAGGEPITIGEGDGLDVRGDQMAIVRGSEVWAGGLDGGDLRRLASLPLEHTLDDLALADDAVWVLMSEPDGIAMVLLRVDLATGAVEERARERLGVAVAIAREHVVFSTLTELWMVPKAGGSAKMLSSFPRDASELASVADVVVGVSDCGGTAVVVHEESATVEVLAAGLGAPCGVSADGGSMVWADGDGPGNRGMIVRAALVTP